jgi:signal transduction histidine kinase/CheY-like chemotaxis protein/purine-cytosine permease-like protein
MSLPVQKIFFVRRGYNTWVSNETLEDYALRYTPLGFRRWSELRVANTAFGAVSFLALEAIGAAMVLNYGFANAMWAIAVVSILTFLTALPISVYAARYGVDMDLLTRGAGFGYLGSTVTSLIYASFTFIFLAIEAAIMALALQLWLGWSLWWCYLASSLVVIPLVTYGITLLNRIHWWTQLPWLVLLLLPYIAIAWKQPDLFHQFGQLAGRISGDSGFNWMMFGVACTAAFALMVQVGEQVDFLRFLPERGSHNRVRWWAAVLIAGPGWIIPGALKMIGGAFLAFLVLQTQQTVEKAAEPTQMYLVAFSYLFSDPVWATAAMVLFVIISQIKINITNAYAGSLAWSNFFARLTHSHPGRVVWLVFNVAIALMLMTLGVFQALERVLGAFSIVGVAWIGALVADLVINKPLGWSPSGIEFKRAYLYDINPVGFGAMLAGAILGILAFSGLMGDALSAFAPFVALSVSFLGAALLAFWLRGRFHLARHEASVWSPGEKVQCSVCENHFEAEDMASCPAYGAAICSLCCTLESRCQDRCKTQSRAAEQMQGFFTRLLPQRIAKHVNTAVTHYLMLLGSMAILLAVVLALVYVQQDQLVHLDAQSHKSQLQLALHQIFAILMLIFAVCCWWVVLGIESRKMAQDESNRQNQLLTQEIEAHRLTDAELQRAKNLAESANQAKTRYVAGMTHELRTPLNSIIGYTQILRKDQLQKYSDHLSQQALHTIERSGEHMVDLIDDLLDLARIEAGRLQLEPTTLALPEFLDELLSMVRPQAQTKGLNFHFRHTGRMPDFVQVDAKRLRQVLINLLSNAIRFTQQGHVTLHLDYRREVARFEIIDTGIGIALEDHQRIFMPFERSTGGRSISESGTGLGLTITHLLTELMGGEVSVTSQPGQGSTFTVRLYLPETSAPAPGQYVKHALRWRIQGYIGKRRTLLVVDDQPVQRQMLAGMLIPLGFAIREAASGHECLASVKEQTPDVVLLDLTMDDLNGWSVATKLREQGYTGPITIISANVFENQASLLAQHQCQSFVGKPVIESELLSVLEKQLEIEWVTETPRPATIPSRVSAAPASLDLPHHALQDLLRMSKLGHLAGLQRYLSELAGHDPHKLDLVRSCEHLQMLVSRCDLDTVTGMLRQALHEYES